ncbi:EAL domain-containing response regulator [Pelomonas sp. SE-A7]|uniref:EAL domain-containing response regulator n=1 Tax=Pelomonas sp. SE-A7 TaxID=3054953 RepID=UPI00259CACBF|nr:EAL domain-containing response regulator [Pelomonas sp. SE-A7]MDM4766911.1 EAL domain-containing response regulator [Pelomonas sp. SE-A7]
MTELHDRVVLVVEDSQVQRNHLVNLMQQLHFGTVLQASDGLDALRVLDQHPDQSVYLVLTDIDMPGMDGIELIGRLAERSDVDNLIAMSARDPRLLETVESLTAESSSLHLLGTLTKPVTPEALSRMLLGAEQKPQRRSGPAAAEVCLDEIRAGLEANQFLPFVQPKVAVASGLVKGVEALARWRHPERGLVPPGAFIPVVEGSPLMAQFTLVMVENSLRWLREWQRALPSLTLSLNLSADDLADQGFVDRLMALVQAYEVPPRSLTWEVTETMIMSSQALANLARLGLKGFGLSMDDYGIGYSSMQTLSRSPFTELKIDRIFVDGAAERANRRAILVSSLDMGRRLGIATVAEGVETVADWQLLRELGCDVAQGYLVARPMPAEELIPWARANRARLRGLADGSGGD